MITEEELLKAIRQCERDPVTYGSCEKLANFYIIYDHLFGSKPEPTQKTAVKTVEVEKSSEFLRAVNGKNVKQVMEVMDELMERTLKVINPRIYDAVLKRLEE